MENLERNFKEYLPLNRKERFYTATILPCIICHQNFQHINLFFKLIKRFPQNLIIQPDSFQNNIQFLTEYSLKESANFSGKTFIELPSTKDTPDLVILITKPELYLIVIEAKMFSSATIDKFKEQIEAQEKIIECIQTNLEIKNENIFHLGLVPKNYFSTNIQTKCQILYWEDIIDAYQKNLNGNYFFETLKLALNNYSILNSNSKGAFVNFGQNKEDKLTGLEILNLNKSGKAFFVGRNRGLNGIELIKDRDSGGWKTFKYEVNFTKKTPPNRNWFSVKEFVEFINIEPIIPESVATNIQSDPWHFSHLGKEYFEKISGILGYGGKLDCPIKSIYTGNKGVKYEDENLGRKINPNWWALLLNGRQLKYGTTTGNKKVEGSFSTDGYKRTSWREIKNYKW